LIISKLLEDSKLFQAMLRRLRVGNLQVVLAFKKAFASVSTALIFFSRAA
jgi:hypothetical protein